MELDLSGDPGILGADGGWGEMGHCTFENIAKYLFFSSSCNIVQGSRVSSWQLKNTHLFL